MSGFHGEGGPWSDLLAAMGADPAHVDRLADGFEAELARDDADLGRLIGPPDVISTASLSAALWRVASTLLANSDVASTDRLWRLSLMINRLLFTLPGDMILPQISRAVSTQGVGPLAPGDSLDLQMARTYNFRGCVLAERLCFDGSEEHLTEAIARADRFVPAYCNLARVRVERGDFAAARAACRSAQDIDPEYAVLVSTVKLVDAVERMAAMRAEPPAESAAAFGLLDYLRTYDRPAVPGVHRGTLVELDDPFAVPALPPAPTAGELNHRGVVLARIGELDEATAMFDAALALDIGYHDAYFNRGSANHLAGRLNSALEDLSAYIRAHPAGPDGYEKRAKIHRARGDDAEAASDEYAAKLWTDDAG